MGPCRDGPSPPLSERDGCDSEHVVERGDIEDGEMLRERERDRVLDLKLVGTKQQLADTFTKQLSVSDHKKWKESLLQNHARIRGALLDRVLIVCTNTVLSSLPSTR